MNVLPFPSAMFIQVVNCYAGSGGDGGGVPRIAPTVGAVGAQTNSTSTSFTIAYPASIGADDLLVMTVVCRGSTLSVGFSIDTPSGWNLVSQSRHTGGAGELQMARFHKVATGSESGSVSITVTGTIGTGRCGGCIMRLDGADVSGATYASFSSRSGNGGAGGDGTGKCYGSDITVDSEGWLVMHTYATESGISGYTAEAGWTENFDAQIAGPGPDYVYTTTSKASTAAGTVTKEMNTPSVAVEYLAFSYAIPGLPA